MNIIIIITHSQRAPFNLNAPVEARGEILPMAVGTIFLGDNTRRFKQSP